MKAEQRGFPNEGELGHRNTPQTYHHLAHDTHWPMSEHVNPARVINWLERRATAEAASDDDHRFEDFTVALCPFARLRMKKRERGFSINTAPLWSPSPLWYQLDGCTVCISNFPFSQDILHELSVYWNFYSLLTKHENCEWHISKVWLVLRALKRY